MSKQPNSTVAVTWTRLNSQGDLDGLSKLFGGFHDSCLREAHVWTEHFVYPDLGMHCSPNLDVRARLLIQRQCPYPFAVELLFEQILTLHLQPSPENYDSIIYGATMLHDDSVFYWANAIGWSPMGATHEAVAWIAAKKFSWRDASQWMGSELRYGANDSTYPISEAQPSILLTPPHLP